MKLILDPVYTGRPSTCSTSYLAWEIIEEMVARDANTFFYLMCPEQSLQNEVDKAFLEKMPDHVIPVPYDCRYTDRVTEMFRLPKAMCQMLAIGETPFWDWDGVITSRIPQLPFMRNFSGRPMPSMPKGMARCFIGLEEMPIFSFRDTVFWSQYMDLPSLSAYQASDSIVISNMWTKKLVSKTARSYLSPSNVLDVESRMHEAYPIKMERLKLSKRVPEDTVKVVFTGRMTGTRNFKEVAELFRKHYSFPVGKSGKKVEYIVSTNSQSTGSINVGEIDFMDVQMNSREKFHALLKKEAHVVLNLSTVEDFSLSTYEPLLFGLPVIVPNRPWTSFLGPDYPFRVTSFAEAYALVKEFIIDYENMYQKFRKWEKTYWKNEVVEHPSNQSTSGVVADRLHSYFDEVDARFSSSSMGQTYKAIVEELTSTDLQEVDIMEYAVSKGLLQSLDKADWPSVPVAKRPNLYVLKKLMNLGGWSDTLTPGVFRRS